MDNVIDKNNAQYIEDRFMNLTLRSTYYYSTYYYSLYLQELQN